MNRNNIYTIFIIICILAVIASYTLITTELKNTTLTPINTKTQPCPDYWTYDMSNNKCCPSDGNCRDFSVYTFCEKQRFLEIHNEDTGTDIPWNGISNIYNPRCDIKVEPHTDNTPDYYENNNEYGYIKSLLVYSLLMIPIVLIEKTFNGRGIFIMFFFMFMMIEFFLFTIVGGNFQSMIFSNFQSMIFK
tara:strand:+ start:28 stop:597 length:570 start_codon:yes stop_codon:yes gene_type:complete